MARTPVDFLENTGGHNDATSPFSLPKNQSPNCRGCHVNEHGRITKRLGLSRVITDGDSAGYNIYRQQGGRGLFRMMRDTGDEYNILLKQEGATAADGAVTHCHLYKYTTASTVTKLTGVEHLPPVRTNARSVHIGPDLLIGFPCKLGDGPGTCTTAASTTVTLSGSYATTAYGMVAGYLILIEGEPNWLEISAVAPGSDTTKLTLSSAATTTGAGKSYVIAPRGGLKLEGGDANLTPRWVGIKAPATAATATEADSGGSITSAVNGTYKFRYTYMNDAGRESQMSPEPDSGTAVTGTDETKVTVTLTACTPTDGQIAKYRLYAEKDDSGNWNFVKEGDWGTSVTVTTDAELTLSGERAGPEVNDAPLFACAWFVRWHDRTFGAGDPKHPNWLYFTEQGEERAEGFPINLRTEEHWHVEFTNIPEITGLTVRGAQIFIFGENQVYTLGGYRYVTDDQNAPTDTDMSPVQLCSETGIGCVAADTIADVNGELWFWTHQGLYRMRRGCPELVTAALDAVTRRVTSAYAYLATADYDLNRHEYIVSLPTDDSTTNNLVVRVNVNTLAVMLDDLGAQCIRRVKDNEVHMLSHTGVIHKWDTASTHKDGLLGSVLTVASGSTTTNIETSAAFASYASTWGTLSGSPIMMLTGAAAGDVSEVLDLDDANGAELRVALSAAPSAGDLCVVGGINFVYEFPWIRNERAGFNRKSRLHAADLQLVSQTTGAHTEVGGRGADSAGENRTWQTVQIDTSSVVERAAKIGVWGRYVQARVRNYWPDEHVELNGVRLEMST